ncbi:hypothetical protein [Flavobacterium sp.]|uniref:hypothetical protein n=1 Tax=Flavobacterium sp. TaxID=239 RepID=UPI0037BE7406
MLFVAFYGFTMYNPEGFDSSRYADKLKVLHKSQLNWDTFTDSFYDEEGASLDLYQPLITYLVALYSENTHLLFAIFGLIYGYFYSRNIWLLLALNSEPQMNRYQWILIFTFACILGFWALNGLRMWTAAHIFFYGSFLYLFHDQKKGLVIAATSILVHFSFLFPVGLLAVFLIVKLPWRVLYLLFIASFFISTLNIEVFRTLLENNAPDFLLPKVNTYVGEEYIEGLSEVEEAVWYITYLSQSLTWFIVVMISIIYFSNLVTFKTNQAFSNLFGFTLLFLSISNFISIIPSGGRFLIIAQLFSLALIYLFYVRYTTKIYSKWMVYLTPLLLFYIIVSIRISFDTLTVDTILSNPIFAVFVKIGTPVIDLIK